MKFTEEAIENDKNLGLPLIKVAEVYLDAEFNCRGAFSPVECTELAKDIARRGLQQPIVVRPLNDSNKEEIGWLKKNYQYKMIAGHRRLTAYKICERDVIPSIIKPKDLSEFEARDINAVENLHRKDLNLLQECNAIRHYWMANWTREETAERVGKSPGWVQIRYALLSMPDQIQEAAGQGYIKSSDISELNKYKNPAEQLKAAGIIYDRRKKGENRNVTDIIRKKDKANAKKHRKRQQIFEMIEKVQEYLAKVDRSNSVDVDRIISKQGNCFGTACLAWCAGEITSLQFHEEFQSYCQELGIFYPMPEFEQEESLL